MEPDQVPDGPDKTAKYEPMSYTACTFIEWNLKTFKSLDKSCFHNYKPLCGDNPRIIGKHRHDIGLDPEYCDGTLWTKSLISLKTWGENYQEEFCFYPKPSTSSARHFFDKPESSDFNDDDSDDYI